MTIFGPAWDELELGNLRAFLQDAPTEPLEWEAKSELNHGAVRATVCGFGNGHDDGYLILGAQKSEDGWYLEGIAFPNEDPPSDITDLLANGSVTPYPDGLSVKPFEVGDGKHVAVVRIPPVAVPPCLTRGTVFERVSGKTIPVTDPTRLAALFARGDAAHRRAEDIAERAAEKVWQAVPRGLKDVSVALGVSATGYAPDISSRLFSHEFEKGLESSITTVLATEPMRRPIACRVTQDALMMQPRHASPWLVVDGPRIVGRWSRDSLVIRGTVYFGCNCH